jgi:IclR family acetate operon transcriptional repressor
MAGESDVVGGVTAVADEPLLGTQTISRALRVLGILRQSPNDLGVTELARTLSLNTSTTHRIVRALVAAGYVVQSDQTERYRLGREAYLLGRAAERSLGFDSVAPVLERLSDESGESSNLVVRDGDHGLVVLRVESKHPLRFIQPVGTRIPLHCTSSGKVFLAFAPDITAEVAGLGELRPLTPITITSGKALLRDLEETRARGYAINLGERLEGVRGVAAPAFDAQGTVMAVVAVQGPEMRVRDDRLDDLGRLVVSTAKEVAALLPGGYRI